MRAVDVGVGHHDDLAVARGVDVEGPARPGAYDLDDRAALGVLQHVRHGRLLDVEDLAADRQQRLELGVPGELGGAERGVALDDEQLAALHVVAAAVGELGGQRRGLQRGLPALRVLVLAGGDAGTGRGDGLLQDARACALASRFVEVRNALSSLATTLRHDPAGRRGAEHLLRLALELRLGQTHRDDRGEPLQGVVLDDVVLGDAQQLLGAQHLVHRPGQRPLEAGDMGAALGGGDDVDERLQRRVVSRCPSAARRPRPARG